MRGFLNHLGTPPIIIIFVFNQASVLGLGFRLGLGLWVIVRMGIRVRAMFGFVLGLVLGLGLRQGGCGLRLGLGLVSAWVPVLRLGLRLCAFAIVGAQGLGLCRLTPIVATNLILDRVLTHTMQAH